MPFSMNFCPDTVTKPVAAGAVDVVVVVGFADVVVVFAVVDEAEVDEAVPARH